MNETNKTVDNGELLTRIIDFSGDLQEKVYKIESELAKYKKALEETPSAWLVTGSKVYCDSVTPDERVADRWIKMREDSSFKVPLYRKAEAAK